MTNRNDSRKGRKSKGETEDRLIVVNRIIKVIRGGCRMRFVTPVVVGDEKDHADSGAGKA